MRKQNQRLCCGASLDICVLLPSDCHHKENATEHVLVVENVERPTFSNHNPHVLAVPGEGSFNCRWERAMRMAL